MKTLLALLLLLSPNGCATSRALDLWTTPVPAVDIPALPEVPRPAGDCSQAFGLDTGEPAPCGGVLLPTDAAERARVALELDPIHRREAARLYVGRVSEREEAQQAVDDLAQEANRVRRKHVLDSIGLGLGASGAGILAGFLIGLVAGI